MFRQNNAILRGSWVPSELLQRQYGRRQVMEHMVERTYWHVKHRTVMEHYKVNALGSVPSQFRLIDWYCGYGATTPCAPRP
jgi:hypothetical protein